jgi:hypothetical protein
MDISKKKLSRSEAAGPNLLRLKENTNYGKKDEPFFLVSTLPDNVFVLQRLVYSGSEFIFKGKQIRTKSLDPFQKAVGEFDNDLEAGRRNTKNERYS